MNFGHKPVRPIRSELLRPMIDPVKMTGGRAYLVTAIDLFDTAGNRIWLVNPEYDKTIKIIETQPPEHSASIVLSPDVVGERVPAINFSQILNVERVTEYRIPNDTSSLDTFLEITFVGTGGNQIQLKVGMDISDIENIMNDLLTLMKINADPSYWKGHSLSFPNSTDKLNTINIYHLTPFLADGEYIMWIQSRDNNNKVTCVNVITNFRIFQYSYEKHSGLGILIPNLKDLVVTDVKNISLPVMGSYSEFAPEISKTKSNSPLLFGDITFIENDNNKITFKLINDPDKMISVVSELRYKYGSAEVGELIEVEEKIHQEEQIDRSMKEEIKKFHESTGKSSSLTISCSNCSNNNPCGSKFCNACGNELLAKCNKCGHLSPAGAIFCGGCGLKLAS